VTAYFVLNIPTVALDLNGARNLLDGNRDVLVLDVSEAAQFDKSHLLCAKNYVWNSNSQAFTPSTAGLSAYKTMDVLVYDQTGANSEGAAKNLAGQGFMKVKYMTDGIDDWMAEGYEVFTTAEDSAECTSPGPLAYAGTDQTVNENQQVTLNGSGSSAGVSYAWEQKEGNSVTIDATAPNPSFTAIDLNGPAATDTLVFHLTVTDAGGKKDTDSVRVTVRWNNVAPTANAGAPQTVEYGDTVQLSGSASTDSDNNALSYQWVASGGTISPVLANPATATPSFTAPSTSGFVIYTLTVTDNGGLSDTDTVTITIQPPGQPVNQSPVADAGADQTVTEGGTVTLNGSGSTDIDGTITTREWNQTGGSPAVTLSSKFAVQPTFTAPSVSAATVLTFTLTVTDNDGATDSDTVMVTVNDDGAVIPNQQPTADAGPDQSVKSGATVVLDGTGSSDPDGTVAGYAWSQTDATGIAVTLSSNSVAKPTFAAPAVDSTTIFVFSLTVTDNKGLISPANAMNVTVTKSSGGGGGGGCFISSVIE